MAVKPIPDGYHSVTPYLVVPGVARVIDFLKQAFEARELHRMPRADGSVMHAEVRIGDSPVMLGEPTGEWKAMPASFYLYVPDVDSVYRRALAAGGASISEPADQFYGDRHAAVRDPSGNHWWIATHIEDVTLEEIARRSEAASRQRRGTAS